MNDLINGLFQLSGGIMNASNCVVLYRAKKVSGVNKWTTLLFAVWGIWNLYYYPTLNQWYSLVGSLLMAVANIAWFIMSIYYSKKTNKNIIKITIQTEKELKEAIEEIKNKSCYIEYNGSKVKITSRTTCGRYFDNTLWISTRILFKDYVVFLPQNSIITISYR
jgi:hypothetical protein